MPLWPGGGAAAHGAVPLSHQIRQLEDELGVPLFLRTTRKVVPTAAGERYLERVREILRGVEVAGDKARRIAAGATGHLAIGFTGSATYELLPSLSRDLRESFPGIELDVGFRPSARPPVRDPGLNVHVLRV